MAVVRKRPAAEADLDNIWWYIAEEASPERATAFLRKLDRNLERLADFPLRGKAQDHLIPGLRRLVVESYLVFYFPLDDGIDVVRVLHGRRDIDALFG